MIHLTLRMSSATPTPVLSSTDQQLAYDLCITLEELVSLKHGMLIEIIHP